MIVSLLDQDFYKLTMQQLVLHQFPNVEVEYDLSIRSKGVDLRPFREDIEREIRDLQSLMLSPKVHDYFITNYADKHEGYVIRNADGFKYEDFASNVAKYVRANHVQTDSHWMHSELIKNQL